MPTKNYTQYTTVSYSGRRLLEKYSLEETGVWQVYGEDSNQDLHGSHHEPLLGTFEGTLGHIIEMAVDNLPRFWSWGGGGRIEKINISKVDGHSLAEIARLLNEKDNLTERLKEINASLQDMEIK